MAAVAHLPFGAMSRWGPPTDEGGGQAWPHAQAAEQAAQQAGQQVAQHSSPQAPEAAQAAQWAAEQPAQLTPEQQQQHQYMIQLAQAQLQQQVQQATPAVPEWKKLAFQALGAAQGGAPTGPVGSAAPAYPGRAPPGRGQKRGWTQDMPLAPCWYYERGMCLKGKQCSFLHQGQKRGWTQDM